MSRLTDKELAMALVINNPGLTQRFYQWIKAGGRVVRGKRVGTIRALNPAEFDKVIDLTARFRDLSKLHLHTARSRVSADGVGLYPLKMSDDEIQALLVRSPLYSSPKPGFIPPKPKHKTSPMPSHLKHQMFETLGDDKSRSQKYY